MDPAASLTVMQNRPPFPDGLLLQNTRNAITIAMTARVKEIPSTQRTTPVVSPCRALVAVSIWGCWSDMRHANATAKVPFHESQNQ